MNFLITAGNTQAMIDRVRCITNIFSGATGAAIAHAAWSRGYTVTLATSRPDALIEFGLNPREPGERFTVLRYQTFDELATILENQLRIGTYDVVCHSAAVSDYLSAGAFTSEAGTLFNAHTGQWESRSGLPSLAEQKAGKIKSSEPEMWIRLVRAPKLIDHIRQPWGFTGVLVKFKLEVGLNEPELLEVAETARQQSAANLIVANTLEGALHWAYIGPIANRYERVTRRELPDRLLLAVEDLYQRQAHNG